MAVSISQSGVKLFDGIARYGKEQTMSDDLIKRSDAINLCGKWRNRTNEHHDKNGWYIADTLLKAIKELPSADRPQGEWEERPSEDWISIRRWYCSECGEWQTYGMTNYCPNCGADMRGDNDGKDIQSADE